jgi:hypothetical protein
MADFAPFGGADEESAEIKRLNAEIVSIAQPDIQSKFSSSRVLTQCASS